MHTSRRSSGFPILVLAVLLVAQDVAAESWRTNVTTGTDFPISIGGRASVATPSRVHFQGSIGYLPGPYADLINEVIVAAGGYDEDTGELVRGALRESLVLHLGADYPVRSWLRVGANWSLVTLGGSGTTSDVVAGVAGVPLLVVERGRRIDVAASLQMLGFEVACPVPIGAVWQLEVALGARFTVRASTDMESEYRDGFDERYLRDAEAELDDIFESYAHTPVFSLRFGRAL